VLLLRPPKMSTFRSQERYGVSRRKVVRCPSADRSPGMLKGIDAANTCGLEVAVATPV